jgi:hypothetical protein
MEERNLMRKRITLLIAALVMALTMAFATAIPAFAVRSTTTVCDPPQSSGHCTTTEIKGSHGTVTETTGNTDKERLGGGQIKAQDRCKRTGSEQTDTC